MGVGGFGVAKYNFWDQNDIVLTFLGPKRCYFSHHKFFFFFFFCRYLKTTSFWTARVQNDVILNKLSLIQNDVIWVSDNLSIMTSYWILAV